MFEPRIFTSRSFAEAQMEKNGVQFHVIFGCIKLNTYDVRVLRRIYACPREKRITFKLDGINYVSVHIAHALNDTTNKLFKIIIKIVRVIATNQNRRWNAENVRWDDFIRYNFVFKAIEYTKAFEFIKK